MNQKLSAIPSFNIAPLPELEFGAGAIKSLPDHIHKFGQKILLITGGGSIENSSAWEFINSSLNYKRIRVTHEPSPDLIDRSVSEYQSQKIDVVVGLGGGSVLDAAKAIAGLLPHGNSVMDHLEGVGPELEYSGPALPFIAVPTTAGTGSEATKNAVLSVQGKNGFKKSFRDPQLIPKVAIVDPDLLSTCPADLIAANGMDAFTQLLESYVSTRANPMTDALAIDGIKAVSSALMDWYKHQGDQHVHRTKMAYASMLSGITLAQVGLGSVHGLASPLGSLFPIPHGVVCGTLLAKATEVNIKAMADREPNNIALSKYALIGRALSANNNLSDQQAFSELVNILHGWTHQLKLPTLAAYDVTQTDFPNIIKNSRGSSMKTNPIILHDHEIEEILEART